MPTVTHSPSTNGRGFRQTESATRGRRGDIEGLRGLAVLLVVLYHLNVGGFRGGFIGVDLFFVISGYVVTLTLLNDQSASGSIDVWSFYSRRLRRVLPASAFVLLGCVAWMRFRYTPLGLHRFQAEVQAASIGVVNLWYASHDIVYGGRDYDVSPFRHFWSLAVEEQFYVIWPLLVAVGMSIRRRSARAAGVLLAATWITSLVLALLWARSNPNFAFFLLPSRAWELLGGCVLAIHGQRIAKTPLPLAAASSWVAAILLAYSATSFADSHYRPVMIALFPVAGAMLIVAPSPATHRLDIRHVLTRYPIQRLGRISYGIYLWHWPIVIFYVHERGPLSTWSKGGAFILSLLAAEATFRLIECPVRYAQWPTLRPRLIVATSVLAVLGLLGVCSLLTRTTVDERILAATALPAEQCLPSKAAVPRTDCDRSDARMTIVLIGDSHANHWAPALAVAASATNSRLYDLTGCAWFGGNRDDGLSQGACNRKELQSRLALIRRIDPEIIVVSNFDQQTLGRPNGGPYVPPKGWLTAEQYISKVRTTASRFPSKTRVVVLGDVPTPMFDVPECLSAHRKDPLTCSLRRSESADRQLNGVVRRAAYAAGASYVDTTDWVCPRERCPVIRDGVVLYRDSNHLSVSFAQTLAPPLTKLIEHVDSTRPPSR